MASKYQEQHYEDVARVLNHARLHEPKFGTGQFTAIGQAIVDFADLFAADSPRRCSRCWLIEGTLEPCRTFDKEHNFTDGFDCERFLKACGLETEG